MKKDKLVKDFIKDFYRPDYDFEIMGKDKEGNKWVWFKDPGLLKKVVDNNYLLKQYKDEFPDIENDRELLDAIANFIVREAIVIDSRHIEPFFF